MSFCGPMKKSGGRVWDPNRRRFLKEFMQRKELIDLGYSGPQFINFCPLFESSPKPFKFEAYWIRDPDCISVVSNSWNGNCHGSLSSQWLFKLKSCRNALSKWSNSKFKNNRKEINKNLAELE